MYLRLACLLVSCQLDILGAGDVDGELDLGEVLVLQKKLVVRNAVLVLLGGARQNHTFRQERGKRERGKRRWGRRESWVSLQSLESPGEKPKEKWGIGTEKESSFA